MFLESAGRPDARAPGGLEAAAGLTQILAETGSNLLGMQVDVAASERYTRRLARAERRGRERAGRAALREARARVDERFDPEQALAGTARYLAHRGRPARARGPRLRLLPHGHRQPRGRARRPTGAPSRPTSSSTSTPRRPATGAPTGGWRRSATTPPTTGGSCSRRGRSCGCGARTRGELDRLAALHTAKASAEEVLHPRGPDRRSSRRPTTWRSAWDDGDDRPVPGGRGGDRAAARPADGRAGASGSTSPSSATAACGPRRSRWRSTSAPRCAS